MFLYNNVARSLHLHKGYYHWPLYELYGPECSCSAPSPDSALSSSFLEYKNLHTREEREQLLDTWNVEFSAFCVSCIVHCM